MAEEGGLTSINDGSDADFEYTCSPCGEGDIKEQAIKYCPVCQEYLCATCTRHHGRQRATRSHILLKSDASTKADVTMISKCHYHPDYVIYMYCGEHDMVFCAKCIATEHRSCTGVSCLENVTISTNQKNEIERLKTVARNIQKRLEDTERNTQTNIENVKDKKGVVTSQIEEMERNLVEHIRKLKNKAMENLESDYTLVNESLESNISLVDRVKQKIEKANWQLNHVYSLDKKQLFIQSKLVHKTVNDALDVLEQCEAKGFQTLSFKEDTVFKSSVFMSTSLGFIERKSEGKSLAKLASKIYQVKSKKEVNGFMKNERSNCYIRDICKLPDGTVILADYNNKKIKRLDVYYNIKDCFDVEAYPTGICCTGNTEVAVKLSNNKVQFISVGSSFSKLREISVSCGYNYGLAYFQGELWLSAGRAVAVYNTSGTLLQTINTDESGQCIFKLDIQQMAVSGEIIIVADDSDGAVCLRRDGTVKNELRDGRLKETCGVGVSDDGTVFIAGYNSHNIVMFDSNGKCLGELLDENSGLEYPTSLLYDERSECLVVGCCSNIVKVYDI